MQSQEARPGTAVRVKESYRRPELEGMSGTIEQCWGSPDYLAVDVRLEDGRSELFWFHQLDTGVPVRVAYYNGSWLLGGMQNLGIARSGVITTGRKRPSSCVHRSPILVERVGHDGYGARCLVCGTVGPTQNSTEEARDALQAAGQ